MKKVLSLIVCFVMCISMCTIPVSADAIVCTPQDNPVFTIVGPVTEAAQGSEASHGKVVFSNVSRDDYSETSYIQRIYEDGAVEITPLTSEEFYGGYMYFADKCFPAYLDKKDETKIIKEESQEDENGYSITMYLIETEGGVAKSKTPLYIMESTWDEGALYYVYKITLDESGKEIRTPLEGSPFTAEAYYDMFVQSPYNDGLIHKGTNYEEGRELPGFFDANGNCVYEIYGTSYFTYDYNLGYIIEVSNNGGTLDWFDPDAEKQRVFETTLTDITTSAKYQFQNMSFDALYDSGYGVISLKDAAGEQIPYLIKLKNPPVVTVHLDGEKIGFDQTPVIENGRTLVPLRAIFESLGASVIWDGETQTVIAQKGDTIVALVVGSTSAFVNEEPVTLDVPAKIINGRTLVPVRFIADCFGVETNWDGELRKVELTTK